MSLTKFLYDKYIQKLLFYVWYVQFMLFIDIYGFLIQIGEILI